MATIRQYMEHLARHVCHLLICMVLLSYHTYSSCHQEPVLFLSLLMLVRRWVNLPEPIWTESLTLHLTCDLSFCSQHLPKWRTVALGSPLPSDPPELASSLIL